jgi:hypothetical protein
LLIGAKIILRKQTSRAEVKKGSKAFTGMLNKRIVLKASYKKKEYKASLRKDGKISFNGKQYNSPSTAAFAVSKTSIDGWYFWKYKDEKGNWIKLNELRK